MERVSVHFYLGTGGLQPTVIVKLYDPQTESTSRNWVFELDDEIYSMSRYFSLTFPKLSLMRLLVMLGLCV